MHHRSILLVVGVCVLAALTALPAQAAFPGRNGKIAFNSGGPSIFSPGNTIEVMNPDGTGRTTLTTGSEPAWSPDGRRIAFIRGGNSLYVAAADGSGATQIFAGGARSLTDPTWSPDAAQIAFVRVGNCDPDTGDFCDYELLITDAEGTDVHSVPVPVQELYEPNWSPDGTRFVGWDDTYFGSTPRIFIVDVDGSDFAYLTPGHPRASYYPSWSPDGSRIAYVRVDYGFAGQVTQRVVSIRPDGSNQIQLWSGFAYFPPAWAPDGSRVLLAPCMAEHPCPNDLVLVDPDGDNPVKLTDDDAIEGHPDWQPIPVNAYPRPRAATPLEIPLVPAYNACTAPNRQHGPPLAYDSCNPPAQASDELALGTPDANAKPVRGEGLVRYTALAGNPANQIEEGDVRITVELHDVYEQGTPLTGYSGDLRARTTLRITDKLNAPHPGGPGAATVADTTLGVTVPCVPNPNQGADCAVVTSADALAPGTVIEGKRAVWELGQVQVDDGGADGDADTPGDNTLFMTQGLFVP